MADEGGAVSTKFILGSQKTIKAIFNHARSLFLFFPFESRDVAYDEKKKKKMWHLKIPVDMNNLRFCESGINPSEPKIG